MNGFLKVERWLIIKKSVILLILLRLSLPYSGKVWRINRSGNRLLIVSTNWMVLVWQIMDDSPHSANFPAIR